MAANHGGEGNVPYSQPPSRPRPPPNPRLDSSKRIGGIFEPSPKILGTAPGSDRYGLEITIVSLSRNAS